MFCLQLHMLVFHDHAGDAVENNLQGALFRLVRGDVKRVPPFFIADSQQVARHDGLIARLCFDTSFGFNGDQPAVRQADKPVGTVFDAVLTEER
ncbi:Uncharacterised protein [Salmonella enterica subsp. enterica serovar Typhi]|nr:Uncharacterised protein [Salmonella enterica subsp. enterica serovar Typhi]